MASKSTTSAEVKAVAITGVESVADQPRGSMMAGAVVAHGDDGKFYVHRIRWTNRAAMRSYIDAARKHGTLAAPTWVACNAVSFAVTQTVVTTDGELAPGTGPLPEPKAKPAAMAADFVGEEAPTQTRRETRCATLRPVYHNGQLVGYPMFA